jgi:hypothetical protein
MSLHTPDLTKFPPRSPRVRLGGYVILPRMLDKGRATLAGKNGEYHYACPLDQGFLEFAGIDSKALEKELGKSDTEVLEWITAHAKHKRTSPEIIAWTNWTAANFSMASIKPRRPNARISLLGSTCSTPTTLRLSVATRKFFQPAIEKGAKTNSLRPF